MDLENNSPDTPKETQMTNTTSKIAISFASDQALTKGLLKVNDGFDGGRVHKMELASWLILRGVERLNAAEIEEIRHAYFDPIKYLESLLRKFKAMGPDAMEPEELNKLQALTGQGKKSPIAKKKSKILQLSSECDNPARAPIR